MLACIVLKGGVVCAAACGAGGRRHVANVNTGNAEQTRLKRVDNSALVVQCCYNRVVNPSCQTVASL
jgi:hypothetical protein